MAWAFEKLWHYLLPARFTLKTDHLNLVAGLKRNSNQRVLRRMRAMQEFNFDIEHVAGSLNVVADMLSRCNPPYEEDRMVSAHVWISADDESHSTGGDGGELWRRRLLSWWEQQRCSYRACM